ncbi:hypothetical protein [Kitasatospora azatica]|uniref:hypothetical protein n=1 Tax=Kitasatospora azatica TaxID=58347 RepID=UPI001E48C343|nr:hypothetical protein [Kitasatospora azatica]
MTGPRVSGCRAGLPVVRQGSRITGRDNLHLVGRFHRLGAREARRRSAELLERFGLAEVADRLVRS